MKIFVTLLTCFVLSPIFSRAAEKPNLIFIFSDDHAQHAISSYGSKVNQTPHLDRLAKEGARFTRSFRINSICIPSRAKRLITATVTAPAGAARARWSHPGRRLMGSWPGGNPFCHG